MGGSGLIGFHEFLRGWKAEGHPGLREQFWELARPPPIRGHAKDIATQMAGILCSSKLRTTGSALATDNKGAVSPLFVGALTEPRVAAVLEGV